ncbi:hypothetical protein BH10PSE7_BH10PSE7_33240 [soil metagenome]
MTPLAPYVIRWGLDASSDMLRKNLRCTACGQRGAALQIPSFRSSPDLAFVGAYPTFGNGTLLTAIVRDMIEGGSGWSGLHVGFLAGVNRYAMAARTVAQRQCRSSSGGRGRSGGPFSFGTLISGR